MSQYSLEIHLISKLNIRMSVEVLRVNERYTYESVEHANVHILTQSKYVTSPFLSALG
jgi:hypothetical protein